MSRKVVYLNTNEPEKRFRVLKSKSERDCLPPDSTDIFVPGLIQHYHSRPSILENCCLFSFAQWYSVVKLTYDKQMNYKIKEPFLVLLACQSYQQSLIHICTA